MKNELKPCPFCGGKAHQYGGGVSQETEIVCCEYCGVTMPGNHEIWNERVWIQEHYIVSDEMAELRALLSKVDDKIRRLLGG